MRINIPCFAIALTFLIAPIAARQVGPVSYPTIEYFVADGDLVVRGKVTPGPIVLTVYNDPDEDKPNAKPSIWYQFQKYSVLIEEALRRDRDVVPDDPTGRVIEFLVELPDLGQRGFGDQPDRDMLLSLRATSGWRPHDKISPELCPWIVRYEWGSNQDHMRFEAHWWAYDLGSNHLPAYDISGARITRTADILARARAAAAFILPPRADDDVAYFSPGLSRTHARILPIDQSDHDLYAPVDGRLEEQVRLWLPGILESDRKQSNVLNAVSKLRAPTSQETVRMIQQLATTAPPSHDQWEEEGRWRIPAYDVRRWARRVLLRWRVPPGDWSETFENRLPMTPVRWTGALLLLVPVAIYVILWRWRGWRQRRFGFVSGVLATVMLIGIVGWFRSYWHIDELWYGPAAERHELISNDGMIQFVSIRHWDEPLPLMYGSGDRTGDLDRTLSLKQLHGNSLAGYLPGVCWAEGGTPPWPAHGKLFEHVPPADPNRHAYEDEDWPIRRDEVDDRGGGAGGGGAGGGGGLFGSTFNSPPTRTGTAYDFRVACFHWCYLVAVGAMGPLSWRLASVRAARRRFKGCCGECGYDLRATPREQPCPECGVLRRVTPRPPVDDSVDGPPAGPTA